MIRIVLGEGDLDRYVPIGVPDEAVALWFPGTDPDAEPIGRNYSVRAFDPVRAAMTIDFVVHDGGVATQWATQATPGDQVGMSPPRSWYRPPPDAGWHLL